MTIPTCYSRAEVLALFGVQSWLFENEIKPQLYLVPLDRRPRGRPTEHYDVASVHAAYRKTFGVLPGTEQIDQALARAQAERDRKQVWYRTKALFITGDHQ
jgi:hypothetical protein